MPTTVVEFVVSTTTITQPISTATECAAQISDICKLKNGTLPSPQEWPLPAWCTVIVPTFILLCSFMNTYFSREMPGSANVEMGLERLCKWMVSFVWRKGAKEQQKLDDKKVRDVLGNPRTFLLLK